MQVEIKMKVTNTAMNAIAKCIDSSIERITADLYTISFETETPDEWLTLKRQRAFEKKFNEDMGERDLYYFVDKVSITN